MKSIYDIRRKVTINRVLAVSAVVLLFADVVIDLIR